MNPEIPVTAIRLNPAGKIQNSGVSFIGFTQPVFYTVDGKEIENYISARKKKDLPKTLERAQKNIEAGNTTVTLNEKGEIEMITTRSRLFQV